MNKRTWISSLSSIAGLAVLLAILVTINILAATWRARVDLTEEKLFTLSAGTRDLIRDLVHPVTLKFYFSKGGDESLIPLKQYAQRVVELLREYEGVRKGHVVLETYHPEPDSEEEEWAQRYGIAPQALGFIGGPNLYFGLVAVSGTHEATLPFISPNAEPQLEYLVTRMIYEVSSPRKPRLAIISPLPVMGAPASPFGPPQRGAQPWAFVTELKKQYDVSPLEPETREIPAGVDTVILIHPKQLSDDALFALDQFVLRGGRLLAFMDPLCAAEQETRPDLGGGMFAAASDLNRLTRTWGLEMNPTDVVCDRDAASQVSFEGGGMDVNPAWLSLRGANIEKKEIATSLLESMMLPFAGSLRGTATGALERVDLLFSSASAGVASSFELLGRPGGGVRDLRDEGVQPLAVRLKGRFTSAFPDGPPVAATDTNAGEAVQAPTSSLKESAVEGVVVLVADVDMIYDRFCIRPINFFGQVFYEPRNDNLNFVLNLVEELAGSQSLIGLRSRGRYERPFEKVIALEKQAQEKWRAQEEHLQRRLEATQARINELQAAKQQDQKFVLSPEQKREIENFRKQRFETQQELKSVRKNLRKEIESLGFRLKLANMALVPALVAVFGVARGWRRRTKASA